MPQEAGWLNTCWATSRTSYEHMKKFLFILGILVMAAGLIGAGWYIGIRDRVLTSAYAITTLDKHLTDAAGKAVLIEEIDSGRIADARHSLQLELDSDILTVDALLDSSDARSRDLAGKLFARIAANRAAHPTNYTGSLPRLDADVDAKIASILQRSKQEQTK